LVRGVCLVVKGRGYGRDTGVCSGWWLVLLLVLARQSRQRVVVRTGGGVCGCGCVVGGLTCRGMRRGIVIGCGHAVGLGGKQGQKGGRFHAEGGRGGCIRKAGKWQAKERQKLRVQARAGGFWVELAEAQGAGQGAGSRRINAHNPGRRAETRDRPWRSRPAVL
jgi:hypothetical protein